MSWQYTSEGRLAGYRGGLDLNWCYKDYAASKAQPSGALSLERLAEQVLAGQWGNGEARKQRLTTADYDYDAVQHLVNQKIAARRPQLEVDGYLGAKTIRALQHKLETPEDGVISSPSMVIKELQRRLNQGRL